jgi:general stress protein 26
MPSETAGTISDSVERLHELIEDIEVAMLTTRRRDGSLISRPMGTQGRLEGAHLWFVTAEGLPKLSEIAVDPNVNLAYYKNRTKEWVSVSGVARIVRDRAKIRELYDPAWKVWFPDEGSPRDGGPDDPRMVLIAVEARSAHFMSVDKAAPVVLFEYLKGLTARRPPRVGSVTTVRGAELD